MTMRTLLAALIASAAVTCAADDCVWLDELDLREMSTGWGDPRPRKSCMGKPIKIGTRTFDRGVGTHAISALAIETDGKAIAFDACVGADAIANEVTSVRFSVLGDGRRLAESPIMRAKDEPYALHVDLKGVKRLILMVEDAGDGIARDHADWGDARFTMASGARPRPVPEITDLMGLVTPPSSPAPRINGPRVTGVRPGHDFIYRLPVTGARPITFAASDVPSGLSFDAVRGILTGKLPKRGEYSVRFSAENAHGRAERTLRIVVGDRIALTPPMGWNSWNCFAHTVTAKNIREAAEAFESSGLVDHGWSYVNIDDYWQNRVGETDDETLKGPMRHPDGTIVVNKRFPDMKELTDFVHAKGLKIGLYSSPGPTTCGECVGSWKHEWTDAKSYAEWGFDYLKYDWCGYRNVTDSIMTGFHAYTLPYRLMGEALTAQNRDIVYSLCQYGMGNVFTWGANVGGHCWRTTEDIKDSWPSVSSIIARQAELWPYARPGEWNDPDMLVLGKLGWGNLHPSRLKTNEQYTHMSFWCVLCSPLLIGCDLTDLDDFTKMLLTNDEVLETNQDELGAQAARVQGCDFAEVWAKPMVDGSLVFALYNKADAAREIVVRLAELGVDGEWKARDLWRQRNLGSWAKTFSMKVYPHATELVRFWPTDAQARLHPGLRDIRDNATYRHFAPVRPVDKPGYGASERPCADCPRK